MSAGPDLYDGPVAAGMALLDERLPGWERGIDLETLTLSDCTRCVLGQLFRRVDDDPLDDQEAYVRGCEALNLYGDGGENRADRYGFELPISRAGRTWAGLTATWKRAIRARLDGAS